MPPTYLLSVEIKTFERGDAAKPSRLSNRAVEPQSEQLDAHSSLLIFCDPQGNCFIAKGIDEIKTAIIGSIPHLGTNFRHPLFFNVQILPGDQTDALIASIQGRKLRGRRFRQTGKN